MPSYPRSKPFSRRASRGSALILVVIILAVLALMGAAALSLSQQEAANVSRQVNYQMLVACAEAAQRKLWAEMAAANGSIPQTSRPTVIPHPYGEMRMSAGHFDQDPLPITDVQFRDNAIKETPPNATSGGLDIDDTNRFSSGFLNQHYFVYAHCRDSKDRQYEVELMVKFGL